MRMQKLCLGLIASIAFAASAAYGQQAAGTLPTVAKLTPGQALYARHCAACHGELGDAKGLAANFLYPKPRDFRGGKYRLVSTDNNVPTRDDLNAVLLRGMPGSSMPSWAHLSQADRDLLVAEVVRLTGDGARERYIRKLKDQDQLTDEEIKEADVQEEIKAFAMRQTTPGSLTEVPALAGSDAAAIARGKSLYTRQSCHSCHGAEGKGDGVQKMNDDEGFVMRPRDLTRGIYKGGHDIHSLYLRILNGMPGTPMPASKNLKTDEIRDMVHFLRSLSTEEQRQSPILKREKIVIPQVTALPADSDERAWRVAPPVQVRLTPLWWRDDAVSAVQVQAVHDGRSIVFRLEWADAVANTQSGKTEAFKDAVALQLVAGPDEPFLGMGSPTTPIDLWMWDADRGQPGGDLEDVNPRVVVDVYPFSEKVAETADYARLGTKTAEHPEVAFPAQATGNQVARSAAHPSGGSSLTSAGVGSTTFRVKKSQLVAGTGRWSEGRWTVLVRRSLAIASPEDGIALAPAQTASVALAVWDGAHRDRNGQKQISIWQELVLEAAR
jgi:mono/diheme cytochrome c family protein